MTFARNNLRIRESKKGLIWMAIGLGMVVGVFLMFALTMEISSQPGWNLGTPEGMRNAIRVIIGFPLILVGIGLALYGAMRAFGHEEM